jgi:hypothetical protein
MHALSEFWPHSSAAHFLVGTSAAIRSSTNVARPARKRKPGSPTPPPAFQIPKACLSRKRQRTRRTSAAHRSGRKAAPPQHCGARNSSRFRWALHRPPEGLDEVGFLATPPRTNLEFLIVRISRREWHNFRTNASNNATDFLLGYG